MKKISIAAIAAFTTLSACKPNIHPVSPDKGNADFSVYVSVGNSLTAGYADGTLYRSGQQSSYPSMLADQFAMAGGGTFKQPLLPGDAGWPTLKRVLGYSTGCDGATSLGPVFYSGPLDTTGSINSIAAQGPYNNVGVPGIRCIDYLTPGYAYGALMLGGVGYAYRFYPSPTTNRPLDVASLMSPTFFTMWLGSNDVLGYATSGGEGNGTGGTGTTDISPATYFKLVYDSVVNVMTSKGAKGALINIPDVTAIPYFTTVPPNALLLRQGQADTLTAAYAPLGIKFNAGLNYFIIQDPAAPGGLRQAKAGEYILLTVPQDSIKCAGWGSRKPIPKRFVLDATEVANVQAATATFNGIIADNAAKHGLALMDANTYLKTLTKGITYNGITYTPTFVTGGAFSLDGVHLTPRGYALVANEILRMINLQYSSTLPMVDPNKYSGIKFPN
jgi:lysophospholipase L1-like esterase